MKPYPSKPLNSHKSPLGYRYLRTWEQANEIFELTEKFVATLPPKHPKTGQYLTDLKDQMVRSARSVVRNIEEGYRRNNTKQYIDFLGFSAGSNEELLGDFEYCLKSNIGDSELSKKAIWLCKGEGKMLSNQMKALKNKVDDESPKSQNQLIKEELDKEKLEKENEDKWLEEEIKKINKGN